MPRNFPSLSIRARLYAGFLALVALGLTLAGFGSWGINRLDAQATRLERMTTALDHAQEMQSQLESIRRSQIGLIYDGATERTAQMREAQAKVGQTLVQMIDANPPPERLAIYRAVKAELEAQVGGSARLATAVQASFSNRDKIMLAGDVLNDAAGRLVEGGRGENPSA